jgi:hypothetical protein
MFSAAVYINYYSKYHDSKVKPIELISSPEAPFFIKKNNLETNPSYFIFYYLHVFLKLVL